MAGDAPGERRDSRVLVEETRRVLDAQQQLVEHQRNRATSAIRIVLTACGLLLTLVSLGITNPASNEPIGVPGVGSQAGGLERTLVVAFLAALSLLTCRMLCAALVVLEPRTAAHPLARALTIPLFSSSRPDGAPGTGLPPIRFDAPPSVRTGLDAEAATGLSESEDAYQAVLSYNAGCVAGNAIVARHNRWYLTRVYRSATLLVVLLTVALVSGIALSIP